MIWSLISALVLTHTFFFWAQKIKNWGVIDIAWGLGFLFTTYTCAIYYHQFSLSSVLVLLMVSIWGLRLAFYLFKRNHGQPEDWRYQQFRKQWAPHENIQAYLKVFVFQGVLMFLITLPQMIFIKSGQSLEFSPLVVVGVSIWCIGMTFEILADLQLAKFKANPLNKGKIMTQGVWALSRHPNYFGEVSLWWGFYLMLLSYIPWWTVLGPVLITFFIVKVTGLPLLEQRYENRLGFKEYKERTNMFLPWFPKK